MLLHLMFEVAHWKLSCDYNYQGKVSKTETYSPILQFWSSFTNGNVYVAEDAVFTYATGTNVAGTKADGKTNGGYLTIKQSSYFVNKSGTAVDSIAELLYKVK